MTEFEALLVDRKGLSCLIVPIVIVLKKSLLWVSIIFVKAHNSMCCLQFVFAYFSSLCSINYVILSFEIMK